MDTLFGPPPDYLVGRSYTFPDGASIVVTQLKLREDGYWVIYETRTSPVQPKMGIMPMPQFIEQYSHLFTQSS